MKKCIYFIILFLLIIPLNTLGLVMQSDKIYVTDSAGILNDEVEDYIVTYSEFLKENKNIDYYVVSVKSLEGVSLEEYTDYIFDSFNMNDLGLLIVISHDDRSIRIKAGSELSKVIGSSTIDNYIDSYFMPYLKNDDWNTGVKNGYSSFYKLLCNIFKIDSSTMTVYDGKSFINNYRYPIFIVILWICIFISGFFTKSFVNIKKGIEKVSTIKEFIIAISIIINIYLLYFCYLLIPLSVFVVLGFEGVIINNIIDQSDIISNKRKDTRKLNKKRKKKINNKTKIVKDKKTVKEDKHR